MFTLATLIGTGGFIVTAISYILGLFSLVKGFPNIGSSLAGFFTR